jgi:nitrite reductase/ring-hydroxylating ferredoxin subunit
MKKICDTNLIPEEGDTIIVEIGGKEVAIFNIGGEYHAVLNYCVHQGGPIAEGNLTGEVTNPSDQWNWGYENEGEIISCPWHGWKFNVTTGKNVQDNTCEMVTFETEIKEGNLYLRE